MTHPTKGQKNEILLHAFSCGPHKPDDLKRLARFLEEFMEENSDYSFFHLGGIELNALFPDSEDPWKDWGKYLQTFRAFLSLPGYPEKFLPKAVTRWREYHVDAEAIQKLDRQLGVKRWKDQPENFTLTRKNILIVGIDLPGEESAATEWTARMQNLVEWLGSQVQSASGSCHGLTILSHGAPSPRHLPFLKPIMKAAAEAWTHNCLWVHADSKYFKTDFPHSSGPGHSHPTEDTRFWKNDFPWPDTGFQRVQLDFLHMASPLAIRIQKEEDPLFLLDRQYFRGPYLTCSSSNSIVITWRSQLPSSPTIKVGRESGKWERTIGTEKLHQRTRDWGNQGRILHSAPEGEIQFDATLDDLQHDTRYYYAIYEGDHLIRGGDEMHSFTTHPESGKPAPLRCWLFGDSGRGNQPQADVRDSMLNLTSKEKRPVDLFLHCGDMAYSSGTDDEFHRNFFIPYEDLLPHTILWPTMSNHEGQTSDGNSDIGPYYDNFTVPTEGQSGGIPSGTQSFFGFDYGNVHFICLCSFAIDQSEAGAQAKWLKANLAHVKKRGTTQWLIAYFHHPAYTRGTHNSDTELGLIEMRTHVIPILEEGGVDMIFAGHSHTYERTMLIDGSYETPVTAEGKILDDRDGDPEGEGAYQKSPGLHPHQGHVSLVVGCGGTSVNRGGTCPVMRRAEILNGSAILDFDGDTARMRLLRSDGVVVDQLVIEKKAPVSPKVMENPRLMPPYVRFTSIPARVRIKCPSGDPRTAQFEFISLPTALKFFAKIEFDYAGTDWSGPEVLDDITLPAEQETRIALNLTCSGNFFPHPKASIHYVRKSDGAEEKLPLAFEFIPWKHYTIHSVKQSPDSKKGLFSGPDLSSLPSGRGFIEFKGTGMAREDTEFRIARTPEGLLFEIFAHDEDPSAVMISEPAGNLAHSFDDCVEVFFEIAGEEPHLYHFIVNAAGQRLSTRDGWQQVHKAWESDWHSEVRMEHDGWRTRMFIPYSNFDHPVEVGEHILFNVTRNHTYKRVYSQWSHNNRGGAHSTVGFGKAVVSG